MRNVVRVGITGLDRRRAVEVAEMLVGELAFGVVVLDGHAGSTGGPVDR